MNAYYFNFRRLFVVLACLCMHTMNAQASDTTSVHQSRQKILTIGLSTSYIAGSYLLYEAWYKDYPRSSFHFFDDSREWRGMDKAGHVFSSYVQTDLLYSTFLWAGNEPSDALLKASLMSLAYQSTIEIMDGFSQDWGFSWTDQAANILGNSLYLIQEKLWSEQRIQLKFWTTPMSYSKEPILSSQWITSSSLHERAQDLYGSSWPVSLLKDYNAQSFWLSTNPGAWKTDSSWPAFLNLAIGVGAGNLFGGFENAWEDNGAKYEVSRLHYPRYSRFMIALDYDLSTIRTDKPWLRSLLKFLNYIKWPAPALELNSRGEFTFHLLFLN